MKTHPDHKLKKKKPFQNGKSKFGSFVLSTQDGDINATVGLASGEPSEWILSDGNTVTAQQLIHTFTPSNPPNTASVVLKSIMTSLNCRVNNLDAIILDGKWSNLETLIMDVNPLITNVPSFSTWTSLEIIKFHNCRHTGTYKTYPTWTKVREFVASSNVNLTALETWPQWTQLEQLWVDYNALTTVETHPEWTEIEVIRANNNSLTSLEVHSEWTKLREFWVNSNTGLLETDLPTTWTSIEEFVVASTRWGDGTLNIPSQWTALRELYAQTMKTTALHTLTVPSALTNVDVVWVHINNLDATEIDNLLINLDTAGNTNGSLIYNGNPGSADGLRSGAAATAKANLITKGWTVTA